MSDETMPGRDPTADAAMQDGASAPGAPTRPAGDGAATGEGLPDADETASPGGDLGDVVSDDLVKLQVERDGYLDSLRRLQADFENYRKRVQRDMVDAGDRAAERVVARLLPVLDAFELGLQHDPDASGLAKLHDSLLSALESEGLERIDPAGEPFDPNDAEAVVHEGEAPEGASGPTVTAVLRAGYRWRGKVMRAAMVKVAG